jgi:hypothetical protein
MFCIVSTLFLVAAVGEQLFLVSLDDIHNIHGQLEEAYFGRCQGESFCSTAVMSYCHSYPSLIFFFPPFLSFC